MEGMQHDCKLYKWRFNDTLKDMNHYAGGSVMDKRQDIERVAYELYEKCGYLHGREIEHWLEAERIVCSRHADPIAEKPAVAKKTVAAKTASVKAASKETRPAAKGKKAPEGKTPAKVKAKRTGTTQKQATL
jgi:hypothetical protein